MSLRDALRVGDCVRPIALTKLERLLRRKNA